MNQSTQVVSNIALDLHSIEKQAGVTEKFQLERCRAVSDTGIGTMCIGYLVLALVQLFAPSALRSASVIALLQPRGSQRLRSLGLALSFSQYVTCVIVDAEQTPDGLAASAS